LYGVVSKILLRGHRHTITNTEKLTAIEVVLKRAGGVEFIDENGGGPGVRLMFRRVGCRSGVPIRRRLTR